MEGARPRLLVALKPRDDTRETLNTLLSEIPWSFADDTSALARGEVEAMLVGSLGSEVMEFDARTTPNLSFIQRLYTGLDGFPFGRFPDSVRIAGNVGAYAPFVSEHAIALALAAARDLPGARELVRAGRLRPQPENRPLYQATAVVLGYGEIGREIARRLTGFDCRVIGLNRTGAPAPGCSEMLAADRLDEAVALGDFVFEVRPLTRRTAGSVGTAEFAVMRPNAVFVNVGRAGTVDEEALYRHLKAHPTFRAAIDVWWDEDFARGAFSSRFPFAELPNFVGSPHSAGATPSGAPRVLRLAVENLARFFRGETPLYVVDRAEYPR
ncbi:MAG: NAD(P)-dependent oxidoreductase [Thermoplasmata archaeon]